MPARKRHRKPQTTALAAPGNFEDVRLIDDSAAVRALLDDLFAPGRYRPLVLVTTPSDTRTPRVDLADLGDAVGDAADIALVARPEVAWELSNRVPTPLATYGGAIRLWWPYATPQDREDRHPLYVTLEDENGPRTIRAIVSALDKHGYLDDEPAAPSPGPADASAATTQAGGRHGGRGQGRGEDRRAADIARIEQLEVELAQDAAKAARLAAENADLRRQLRSAGDKVAELERRLYQRAVYADPEQQLRHEITTAWLLTYAEDDRDQYPLRRYVLGPDFVTSVDALQGVARERIVDACVDVLTRRVYEMNSRKARQYRTGITGNAPQRARADGAVAWRCNLQTGTPSARRLMWWELVDSTVELARVATHDDHAELH